MYLQLCPEMHSYCSTEPFPKKRLRQPLCLLMTGPNQSGIGAIDKPDLFELFDPCYQRFFNKAHKGYFFLIKYLRKVLSLVAG